MKQLLHTLITNVIDTLKSESVLPATFQPRIQIDRTKDKSHGDFACNIALIAAKPAGSKPRDLAEKIVSLLPQQAEIAKVEIAGPGFINFYLNAATATAVIDSVLAQGPLYGHLTLGKQQKIHIEFVSANPTGPLHVGHGRGAAIGAAVADLLQTAGYDVHREYYVNDAGRQMHILATSVWLRYLELHGCQFKFPSNGYKGDYVLEIAEQLKQAAGDELIRDIDAIFANVSPDADADGNGDKDAHIDDLGRNAKQLLGADNYQRVFQAGLQSIKGDIEQDLGEFGVRYQNWFSEQSLSDNHAVEQAIEKLQSNGHLYEKEGAVWFKSTDFGDEKDRVVVRANGEYTYFASDIAYHLYKLQQGYDQIIDIWGADHHGYVPRVKAAIQAMGEDPNKLKVLLVQFAILYRSGERVQMSTRSGSFVTLRELRDEVGNDAARYFYVMRKSDQHMDFDLDLAKSQSNDNPMYYIQYSHARICSIFKRLAEENITHQPEVGQQHYALLDNEYEQALLSRLPQYPEVIEAAAQNLEPHSITHYLRELANEFHSHYNNSEKLIDTSLDNNLRQARLNLYQAVRQVIANGLQLLGVSAPEVM